MNSLTIMIAKHGCKWDRALDDGSKDLEEGRLAVGDVMMQLISCRNYKVRLLDIQYPSHKVYRKWISRTLWEVFPVCIDSIFAFANTSNHVRVRDLDDLESSILFCS